MYIFLMCLYIYVCVYIHTTCNLLQSMHMDWRTHLFGRKLFASSIMLAAQCKYSDLLSSYSDPDCPDEHGLYPLIYAAALANMEALSDLLPRTTMELVNGVLNTYSTTLLNVIIEAPLRKVEDGSRIEEDDDLASVECLGAYFSLNR